MESKLKTKNSERDLPITKEVYQVLKHYMEASGRSSGLLFTTSSGKPYERCFLGRRFNKAQRDAGLPHIVLHSLRHMVATSLRDAGVDVKTYQMILGHADPVTTLRIYTHSNMDNKIDAMQKLNTLCLRHA